LVGEEEEEECDEPNAKEESSGYCMKKEGEGKFKA
jgi:hypothetical protein